MRFNSLALVTSGLILTASLAVAQASKSLTGTVSDSMCGKTHMMKGESAAQCTRECVKSGSDYASWSEIRSVPSRVTRLRLTNSRAQTSSSRAS